jgi:hypothetical protein
MERGQGLKKAFMVHLAKVRRIDKTRLLAPGIASLPAEMTVQVNGALKNSLGLA